MAHFFVDFCEAKFHRLWAVPVLCVPSQSSFTWPVQSQSGVSKPSRRGHHSFPWPSLNSCPWGACGHQRLQLKGGEGGCRLVPFGVNSWLQRGCKNKEFHKQRLDSLGVFFGPPRGQERAQNVPPRTSFRTPKYHPNPANGGPIGGKNTF